MLKKVTVHIIITVLFLSFTARTGKGYEHSKLVDSILILQPRLPVSEANKIASAIKSVYTDGTCTIPWQLVVSIAFHESTFRISAVNKKSMDYGMMQISKNNVKRFGLSKDRLMRDYAYGLRVACHLITYNQSKYAGKIPYWVGIYRSGTALWKENIKKNAIQYDRMIRRTAAKIGYHSDTSLARNP